MGFESIVCWFAIHPVSTIWWTTLQKIKGLAIHCLRLNLLRRHQRLTRNRPRHHMRRPLSVAPEPCNLRLYRKNTSLTHLCRVGRNWRRRPWYDLTRVGLNLSLEERFKIAYAFLSLSFSWSFFSNNVYDFLPSIVAHPRKCCPLCNILLIDWCVKVVKGDGKRDWSWPFKLIIDGLRDMWPSCYVAIYTTSSTFCILTFYSEWEIWSVRRSLTDSFLLSSFS